MTEQCADEKARRHGGYVLSFRPIDRSKWRPTCKQHVGACRFGVPGPYAVLVKIAAYPGFFWSLCYCRTDYADIPKYAKRPECDRVRFAHRCSAEA